MSLRRWELIDTRNGQPIGVVSRHLFHWSAEHWRRTFSAFARRRSDAVYELRIRDRDGFTEHWGSGDRP